jgi:dTDP-4-dehydrorhamnose 3,5-epimerase
MEIATLDIPGAWLATSPLWADERGSFREWFKSEDVLTTTGIDFGVGQANISVSARGVVRGIHYSLASGGQAKWVTCVSGSIMDVIVDIRPESATYGKYVAVELVAGDGRAVLIGAGLGHGFISLEDGTAVSYLLSSPYSPGDEYEINPLDPDVGIDWKLDLVGRTGVLLSPKDAAAPSLAERAAAGLLPRTI